MLSEGDEPTGGITPPAPRSDEHRDIPRMGARVVTRATGADRLSPGRPPTGTRKPYSGPMGRDRAASLLVHRAGWGHVEVDNLGRMRDAKLWPGGGREWDWRETGTRHRPGIQPADVIELLDHQPDVIVLSQGRQRRLETRVETLALLDEHRVEVVCYETGAAIDCYNRLAAEGRRVAALLHTTC